MGTEPPCVSITIYSRQSTHPYYVIAHQRHNSLDPYGVFSTTLMTHLYRALVPSVLLLEHLVCSRRCIRKVSSIKLLSEHNFKWKEIKALLFHFRKRVSSKLMVLKWNEIKVLLFHFISIHSRSLSLRSITFWQIHHSPASRCHPRNQRSDHNAHCFIECLNGLSLRLRGCSPELLRIRSATTYFYFVLPWCHSQHQLPAWSPPPPPWSAAGPAWWSPVK